MRLDACTQSRWRLFIGIGFLTVPASLLVAGLESLILSDSDIAGSPLAAREAVSA